MSEMSFPQAKIDPASLEVFERLCTTLSGLEEAPFSLGGTSCRSTFQSRTGAVINVEAYRNIQPHLQLKGAMSREKTYRATLRTDAGEMNGYYVDHEQGMSMTYRDRQSEPELDFIDNYLISDETGNFIPSDNTQAMIEYEERAQHARTIGDIAMAKKSERAFEQAHQIATEAKALDGLLFDQRVVYRIIDNLWALSPGDHSII